MLTPERIVEISTAYWQSATLMAAIQLKIPTHIGDAGASVEDLARRTQTDPIALATLLEGLCALDLLTRHDELFQNTPLSKTFLVEGTPTFMGAALLYNADVYPKWASLAETIRKGKPVHSPQEYLGDRVEQTRNFVYGMHHRALSVGRAVTEAIDLTKAATLFDLGGGPGTYSALLTLKYPTLNATVGDLAPVVKHAEDIVASMGADRVRCVPFDYYHDELTNTYDAILISGVLHREQPEGVKNILKKACDALDEDGVLYISDVMVNDERTGPLFPTMFSINMRVLAHDGWTHSVREQESYLNELGWSVTRVTRLPAPIHYTIIEARKR